MKFYAKKKNTKNISNTKNVVNKSTADGKKLFQFDDFVIVASIHIIEKKDFLKNNFLLYF